MPIGARTADPDRAICAARPTEDRLGTAHGRCVVNAVTPTALRFAPPFTVSDAEIDDAVAILTKVLAG